MHLPIHGLVSLVAGALLLLALGQPLLSWPLLLILLGSTLIDLDSLLLAVIDGRRASAGRVLRHGRYTGRLHLLHSYEAILLVLLLGIAWRPLFWLGVGMLLHLLQDAYTNTRALRGWGWLPDYSLALRIRNAME